MSPYLHFTWVPTYILHESLPTFYMSLYLYFTWVPTYVLHESLPTFYMSPYLHFTWVPTYILHESLLTFYMSPYLHFTWVPTCIYVEFVLWYRHGYSVDQGYQCFTINRRSVFGIVSNLQCGRTGLRIPIRARSFFLLLNFSNVSGAHGASYLIVTGGLFFPGGKAAWI